MKKLFSLIVIGLLCSCSRAKEYSLLSTEIKTLHDTIRIHDTITILDPAIAIGAKDLCNTWFRNGYYVAQNAMVDLYNAENITEASMQKTRYKEFQKASHVINSIK